MNRKIKSVLVSLVELLGFRVTRLISSESGEEKLVRFLNQNDIDVLFDVGANSGQFAQKVRAAGFSGKIISVEPLSVAHKEVVRKSKADPNWEVAPRCALGSSDTVKTINIARNSVSSSILGMKDLHREVSPASEYVGREDIPVKRFDDLAAAYLSSDDKFFIKIDTQGYEKHVVEGADAYVAKASGILCELSLEELYEGQEDWLEMISYITSLNFEVWSLQPGFINLSTGKLLQVDVIFASLKI